MSTPPETEVAVTGPELVVRRLAAADLPAGLGLTQAQNWSHRLHDWELHFSLARGWAVAATDGTLLGTALWWPYGAAFGTIGFVVVRPDAQGRGIGRRLMATVLGDAGPRTLKLAATKAGFELYRRLGFVPDGGIVQRQGEPAGTAALPVPPVPRDTLLRQFAPADLPQLVALDAGAVGAPRAELLQALADVATGGALAVRTGTVVGYALQRAAGNGTTIGPVIAPDEATAIGLVAHLLARHPGFMRIDIPAAAVQLGAFLDVRGLRNVDAVTPMVRGAVPTTAGDARVWAVASQAFG